MHLKEKILPNYLLIFVLSNIFSNTPLLYLLYLSFYVFTQTNTDERKQNIGEVGINLGKSFYFYGFSIIFV